MINFNWVEMTNFLSIGNSPIRINLNKDETTLICGGNGAGKTTVLDGINYSCFNKPLRDVKLGQLVNTINKKACMVKINFTVRGDNYEVHRGQKPAVFKIFKNGDEQDQDASARDLQTKLETDILGTDFRTFNQVVVMASTGYTHFMELSTNDRRNVVEQMLDIEVIGHMSSVLKDRVREVKSKGFALENNYNDLQRSIQEVKNLIEQAKNMGDAEVERIDINIAEVDGVIKSIEDELAALKVDHTNEEAKKPVFDKDAETLRHQNAIAELCAIDGEIAEVQAHINEHGRNVSGLDSDIKNIRRDIAVQASIKSFYVDNDKCDRCNQPIDESFKTNIVESCDGEIGIMQQNEHSLETEIQYHKDEAENLKDTIDDLRLNKPTQQKIIDEVAGIVQGLRDWKARCDSIINQAKNVQRRLQDQMNIKNRLVNDKNDVLAKGNTDTSEYYDRISQLNDEIEELVATRAEITEEAELCKLCEEMLKDKGLKAKIIKQFLPVINQTINHYLECMNANYSFVLDDQFNETIKSRYRDNFSYGSFSNGQRMRIDMALLFMWRKLAESKNTVSSNLLFLDEVLDSSLDKDGIDMLFDVFDTMPNTNIFVVSHRPEIVDRFSHVVTVSLNGNFSHYDGL